MGKLPGLRRLATSILTLTFTFNLTLTLGLLPVPRHGSSSHLRVTATRPPWLLTHLTVTLRQWVWSSPGASVCWRSWWRTPRRKSSRSWPRRETSRTVNTPWGLGTHGYGVQGYRRKQGIYVSHIWNKVSIMERSMTLGQMTITVFCHLPTCLSVLWANVMWAFDNFKILLKLVNNIYIWWAFAMWALTTFKYCWSYLIYMYINCVGLWMAGKWQ